MIAYHISGAGHCHFRSPNPCNHPLTLDLLSHCPSWMRKLSVGEVKSFAESPVSRKRQSWKPCTVVRLWQDSRSFRSLYAQACTRTGSLSFLLLHPLHLSSSFTHPNSSTSPLKRSYSSHSPLAPSLPDTATGAGAPRCSLGWLAHRQWAECIS